jgi:hypothetical protein
MLAYEASDRIAKHIADEVKGHTLYIYDSQTFAGIQSYEAYAVTISAFEMSFGLFKTTKPQSSFVSAAGAAQTVAATLGALRSTAEYAADTVNFQTDPVIAQLANHLGANNVIVPKFVFISSDDLKSSATATPEKMKTGCSDITKTIPDQLGCLLLVRNDAAVAAQAGNDAQKAAFADLDKLFQVFFGTLMGTSVNLSSSTSTPAGAGGGAGAGGAAAGGGAGAGTGGGGGTTTPVPLLSQLIQGHRLKAQFSNDKNSRVLILEATEAGGGSRIKHNFFVELFWITPTPTFTGGAIVTYLLIDPTTSTVEKSDVLRFVVDYGKFHGKKIEAPSNFK